MEELLSVGGPIRQRLLDAQEKARQEQIRIQQEREAEEKRLREEAEAAKKAEEEAKNPPPATEEMQIDEAAPQPETKDGPELPDTGPNAEPAAAQDQEMTDVDTAVD